MKVTHKYDPTPVRRLYKDRLTATQGKAANAHALNADDMPKANPDDIIHALPGRSARHPLRNALATYPGPPRSLAKDAPARMKATKTDTLRPNSRSMARLEPLSPPSGAKQPGWLADLSLDFEQQLKEIERLNLSNPYPSQAAGERQSGEDPVASSGDDRPPTEASPLQDPTESSSAGQPIHVPYAPDLRARPSLGTSLHTHVVPKPMVMRDYQLLAEACQRAGKARMEGHAYYKQGELLAVNRDTLPHAIKQFKKYLNICRRLNDLQGEAKALNCIGICYQELGGADNLRTALEFHRQHAEISDAAGIFIANTNMGLIQGQLDNPARAIEHHKQALQYAVRAGDRQAESLALANLGLMGRSQGDLNTAKVCMERHLALAQTLSDETAAVQANEQLGLLAMEKGDWVEAQALLSQALDLAAKQGHQRKANDLRSLVGVVVGNLKLEEHFRLLAKNMGAKAEKRSRKAVPTDDAFGSE
eukprot:GGOE01018491.1.p1 GENE.GGOE01018491.1~~GGOE01018491.1.p1  ORF type:complete len:477 (+),score=142.53 GGOE01018491.1:72-1502(+)